MSEDLPFACKCIKFLPPLLLKNYHKHPTFQFESELSAAFHDKPTTHTGNMHYAVSAFGAIALPFDDKALTSFQGTFSQIGPKFCT